jgi:thiopurine S-methyltransferase
MKHEFWHNKWLTNDIGFHQAETNPWLVRYLKNLNCPPAGKLFLPLCGKTRDIDWLLSQGYQVIGSELNESAVIQLFERLQLIPDIEPAPGLTTYRSGSLEVFVGDLFALSPEDLGIIDGVYDRAALVALPADMRVTYARHLQHITGLAPQLLISFSYQQEALTGPPFSVPAEEINALYGNSYTITELTRTEVPGGLKGRCPATEVCWLLEHSQSVPGE